MDYPKENDNNQTNNNRFALLAENDFADNGQSKPDMDPNPQFKTPSIYIREKISSALLNKKEKFSRHNINDFGGSILLTLVPCSNTIDH